jgi:hypothetical protein
LHAIEPTVGKCEKTLPKLLGGSPQQTLTARRIKAFKIALDLIKREMEGYPMRTKIFATAFSVIYPLLVQKVKRKGRAKEEVDGVIFWLTGYDEAGLREQLDKEADLEKFFAEAPRINPNAHKITGAVCGVRVEEIEDPLMQKIRWLDKLVDELAKGKAMEKVLRR